MTSLTHFINLLTGKFSNIEQYNELSRKSKVNVPYAEHVNTVCNHKIVNLPNGFKGIFMLEESYYTLKGTTQGAPHLFLFTEEAEGIRLTSYEIPNGYSKDTFTYNNLTEVDFNALKPSEAFTPAMYFLKDGVWEGGSVSMFSPILKFTLWERFSQDCLEVTETMEVNGKRTFGYDTPIIYKRT